MFDLDGTLTRAVHDFDGLRARLDLPAGVPILEAIELRPEAERPGLLARVEEWELEHVAHATRAPGVTELLAHVGGRPCGILTRNTVAVARRTLEAVGLGGRFDPVFGRESATPKPSPDGVLRMLDRWGAPPEEAVLVGDFRLDVEAGNAAGVSTVLVDPSGAAPWRDMADVCVPDLRALLKLVWGGGGDDVSCCS